MLLGSVMLCKRTNQFVRVEIPVAFADEISAGTKSVQFTFPVAAVQKLRGMTDHVTCVDNIDVFNSIVNIILLKANIQPEYLFTNKLAPNQQFFFFIHSLQVTTMNRAELLFY